MASRACCSATSLLKSPAPETAFSCISSFTFSSRSCAAAISCICSYVFCAFAASFSACSNSSCLGNGSFPVPRSYDFHCASSFLSASALSFAFCAPQLASSMSAGEIGPANSPAPPNFPNFVASGLHLPSTFVLHELLGSAIEQQLIKVPSSFVSSVHALTHSPTFWHCFAPPFMPVAPPGVGQLFLMHPSHCFVHASSVCFINLQSVYWLLHFPSAADATEPAATIAYGLTAYDACGESTVANPTTPVVPPSIAMKTSGIARENSRSGLSDSWKTMRQLWRD